MSFSEEYTLVGSSGLTSFSSGGGSVSFSSGSYGSSTSSYGGAGLNLISSGGAGLSLISSGSGSSATVNQIATDILSLSLSSAGGASGSVAYGASASGAGAYGASASGAGAYGASASGAVSYGASVSGAGAFAGSASAVSVSGSVFASQVEAAILASSNPLEFNASKTMTAAGQTGVWLNENEALAFGGNLAQYVFVEDSNPQIVTKKVQQQLEYVQELAIRYLRPPTPPAPGEIVIQLEGNSLSGPAPPLIIRQVPARPDTPEPLVLREAPPQAPQAVGRKVITISGKRLPPPPRKVVIERLAQLPSKPQSVLVERWLPYAQGKRRVIFQKPGGSDALIVAPRNVIVQWEAPSVVVKRDLKYLGVIRANPADYVSQYGSSLLLSGALPQYVLDIATPDGLALAANSKYSELSELEGDVYALNLVDLNANGLSGYSAFLSTYVDNRASAVEEAFRSVDGNNNGFISYAEAQSMLLRFNTRLGRRYGEDEVKVFFQALDVNRDGQLSLQELRRAFIRFSF